MMQARTKSHRRRIIFYALYAWGVAGSATIIAVIADNATKLPDHMKPGIGAENCFLKGERTALNALALSHTHQRSNG